MIYVALTNGLLIGPIMHYEHTDRVMKAILGDNPAVFEVDHAYSGGVGTEKCSFNPDHVVRVIQS